MAEIVRKGSKVALDYEGRLETGEIFDSSKHGNHSHPLEFEAGAGQMIPGFDKAVLGMKVGEEKEFSLKPEEAYGMPNPNLIKEIPRNLLPKDRELKVGMVLMIGATTGQQFQAKIAEVTKESVKIDVNHPLAGKTLIFKIKIISID